MSSSVARRINAIPEMRNVPSDLTESKVLDVSAAGVTCTPITPVVPVIVVIELLTHWAKKGFEVAY